MITSPWQGYQLSRLMLGTVQFGLPYGIANRIGQPSYDEVLAILTAAVERGVNCFDTAAAYGTSEELLGRALAELGIADRIVVVTKVRPLTPAELADSALGAAAVEASVTESRRRLRMDCLPVVLFHRESDVIYFDTLRSLQERGWLRYAGVSCDNRPGPAAEFAARTGVSALQIPANIFDNRHLHGGSLASAAAHGVAVFIRSVYLQGLAMMPESDIPAVLQPIIPLRRQLASLASAAGMDLGEMAVRYMLSQPGVTCVLTGVETVEQVRENVARFERGPLDTDLLTAIQNTVRELPELLITPSQWPLRAT